MKAELNDSLRLRFFAQYLNSCDCGDQGEEFRVEWDSNALHSLMAAEQEEAFLYLREISQLTDDEAIEVAKIMWPSHSQLHTAEEGRWYVLKERATYPNDYLALCDYLRSIGIALPFMGHSVEELVGAGWIKLVTNDKKP